MTAKHKREPAALMGRQVLNDMTAVPRRNDRYFDMWSLVHLSMGVLFGWLVAPLPALLIMAAWEPVEVLVLSPLLSRVGITFGYESLRNSLSDILFDGIGIVLGWWLLAGVVAPPFRLF